ncbi:hypothetical protein P152DRAFT_262529 [Eremomyces bilateralis CBS 781.70]|uniref:Uncharacterized protein n=1 Tax=Eremomyces bilateralis CBS 781.70 TaxID=1392243 RepID=A0A6G1G7X0_9PEZI|nr:uncharacterized protein P152DRAFT_262529 [Eremomyces bilateralis CBS 781.70]KAF1814158.1 hypothetical protein P152DRAFT_262529 [Eremomyces bilateralis CBS 781.70]
MSPLLETIPASGPLEFQIPSKAIQLNVEEKAHHGPQIFEIRRGASEASIRNEILSGLDPTKVEKTLPTLLLYNEAGLKLFERITYLHEYYLTNAEIDVLESHADDIASRIKQDSVIVELGSGNLRKINILLQALERQEKNVDYFALDLDLSELQRTLSAVPQGSFRHVKLYGLHGTYDDGAEWLKSEAIRHRSKCVLSMGSSVGNFRHHEAAAFLQMFADSLVGGDSIIVGLDSCENPQKVYSAYNDTSGVTHQFILNGLLHANEILGEDAFSVADWRVIGEYVYDNRAGRHQAFLSPVKDVEVCGIHIKRDERVRIEESHKYSHDQLQELWQQAGLVSGASWMGKACEHGLHMATKPTFEFPLSKAEYASSAIPTWKDWGQLWAAWDTCLRGMVSEKDLYDKPIDLRNQCVFYLGHIPTFLDIHLTRSTGTPATEPKYFARIFERGIDPDVDNPEQCHSHSEIPNEWPAIELINRYQTAVRKRVEDLYVASAQKELPQIVQEALWLGFEHEAMHLETILYMLLQSKFVKPPPGVVEPNWEAQAMLAEQKAVPNTWFRIPEQDVSLGLNESSGAFGWDNEKPMRQCRVPSFTASARPITNLEYAQFLARNGVEGIPESWTAVGSNRTNGILSNGGSNGITNGVHSNGSAARDVPKAFIEDKLVKTVFGLVPLKYALHWPVMASYDELSACAAWMGGRIPTMVEVRSIYQYSEQMKEQVFENALDKAIPAVNSHLSNNGVQETPPSVTKLPKSAEFSSIDGFFVDLDHADVAFKHWNPVSVTQNGNHVRGQGELGGVWEWTSTPLVKHEGFQPMDVYPGYTADFFDGKHNVVLGGSWATHPRIAGRKTFINWYQRNYRFAWVGARVVRD